MSLKLSITAFGAALLLAVPASGRQQETPPQPSSEPTQVSSSVRNQIPVGQEIDVRLQTPLSSETAEVEQRFEATTVVDVMQDDRVLIPAGSTVRGVVREVDRATRTDRTGELRLAFDEIVVRGETYPIRANATQAFESEGLRGEAGRIGAGAGVGAIIGGILGGVRGALAGILVGAGGTIVATEGKDVELPAGTILRIRLDQPLTIDR
jgi:hypothetical protein